MDHDGCEFIINEARDPEIVPVPRGEYQEQSGDRLFVHFVEFAPPTSLHELRGRTKPNGFLYKRILLTLGSLDQNARRRRLTLWEPARSEINRSRAEPRFRTESKKQEMLSVV